MDLAQRTREKESRRLAAEAKARDEAIANAEKAALDAALVRADKSILGAIERRARIAVPGVAPAKIRADLEAAEAMLREGRRLLLGAVDIVPARREEVLAREAEAMRLLVATLIDLADHHRQASRWTKALDYVRAALLIEPNNARALEVQRQIEEARRTPEPYYFDDPWGGGRGPLIRDYYPYVSPHSYYHHPTPLLRGSSWFSWRGRHGGFWAGW